MIKEPLLRNLTFDELFSEIERSNTVDPIYQILYERWKENQDELQEEIIDLENEVQSLRDDRDDLEYTVDRKHVYINWANEYVSYIIENGFWDFNRVEEKDEQSDFVFEKHYNFNTGGWEFETRKEIKDYGASVIISHGEITKIEVFMGFMSQHEVLNYETPVTDERALSDAKTILVKFIFGLVNNE